MKPPYRVPTMTEISEIPWNGINVVSTFSGAGGSCLGYRMAGCRVLWANEFVPAAREVYKLNHPGSVLCPDDIREVQPEAILEAIGLEQGEVDILDGSPPCASFSTAGKRASDWGEVKAYSDTKQRTDDLFYEFARILEGLKPKAFIAENVAGLVRGKAKGYFKDILQRLKDAGYQVRAQLLDASWLGVPQARKRLFFIGMRNDLHVQPEFPTALPYQYTLGDAVPDIHSLIVGNSAFDWFRDPALGGAGQTKHHSARPSPTVCVAGGFGAATYRVHTNEPHDAVDAETGTRLSVSKDGKTCDGESFDRKLGLLELRRICGFPEDYKLTGTYAKRWERLGRAVPPVMMAKIAARVVEGLAAQSGLEDDEDKEADVRHYAIGREALRMPKGSTQSDRYLSLSRAAFDKPCYTLASRAGAASAASVVHPSGSRKFQTWEARRIQGFPDDFQLLGTYAQRIERLGRAVPPVMMRAIATVVARTLEHVETS